MRAFVEMCDAVAATTKKSEKVRLVSEYLKAAAADDAAHDGDIFKWQAVCEPRGART